MPLSFVVLVSMIKDIFEDRQRHASDNLENNRSVLVGDILTGKFVAKLWKDVHVGMILKIKQDEFFPSDLVLLNSSAPKGSCYIETKNLDGETNLKHKQGLKDLVEFLTNEIGHESYNSSGKTELTYESGNTNTVATSKYES